MSVISIVSRASSTKALGFFLPDPDTVSPLAGVAEGREGVVRAVTLAAGMARRVGMVFLLAGHARSASDTCNSTY